MNYSLTRPLSSHTSGRNPRVLRCWRRRTGHSVAALICFTLNESVNKRNVAVHVCEIAHLPLCPQDLSSRPPQLREICPHSLPWGLFLLHLSCCRYKAPKSREGQISDAFLMEAAWWEMLFKGESGILRFHLHFRAALAAQLQGQKS